MLEILDAAGVVVRHYSSADLALEPHPATDPAAYDKVCQATPTAPFCNVPLYWQAKPIRLSTAAGMHRFSWDLQLDPLPMQSATEVNDEEAKGAVPHATYPTIESPWAPPGMYTVRLTVDGTRYTQPIRLALDPRVRTSAAALAQLTTLSREMWTGAHAAHAAHRQARALHASLDGMTGAAERAFAAQLDSLAPASPAGRPRARRRGGVVAATLGGAATGMMSAANAMQGADVAPTATQVAACTAARSIGADAMARWTAMRTTGLATLNASRRTAGQPAITLPDLAAK